MAAATACSAGRRAALAPVGPRRVLDGVARDVSNRITVEFVSEAPEELSIVAESIHPSGRVARA
jgi:hypothetical protein